MKHRSLSIVGLVVVGVIAYTLIRGQVDLDVAGIRAAMVFALLLAIDRLVMPFVQLIVGTRSISREAPEPRDAE